MKTLINGSTGMVGGVILVLLLGAVGFTSWRNNRAGKVLTDALSVPENGATSAKVEINAGSGNLTIDPLASSEPLLASGALQYQENKGLPTHTLDVSGGQAILSLKMGDLGRTGFRFPWDACNSELNWLIHLNPSLTTAITAHSGGGNIKLDLAGLAVTSVSADTGGGNVDVVLPESASNQSVTAKTGAGNVTVAIGSGATGSAAITATSGAGNVVVHVPAGIAARIHLSSGLGKPVVDTRFGKIDDKTYQSPDYATAANKAEITIKSGAGNVIVDTK